MYSREDASRIKHEFWTTFGRYMKPIPSAGGEKVNWVNYHTGLSKVFFRMNTETRNAVIAISLEHNDVNEQELYFNRFIEHKRFLEETLSEQWTWQLHAEVQDRIISRIYYDMSDVSVFNKNDWPDLISFFKPRIIALDNFWHVAKYLIDV